MKRKKIDGVIGFTLLGIIATVVAVYAIRDAQTARGEDDATAANPDTGPYGLTPDQIPKNNDPFGWTKTPPLVQLKDLPPLPPPFGTGKRMRLDGSIQTSAIADLPVETQIKIAQLQARKLPFMSSQTNAAHPPSDGESTAGGGYAASQQEGK